MSPNPAAPQPIDQNSINTIALSLTDALEKALAKAELAHGKSGPGNLEAGALTALMNLLCLRMARLGVADQDAVNALIPSLRAIRKQLAKESKG